MIHIPETYFGNQALIDYFATYLTESRLMGIERILGERTRYMTIVLEDVFRAQNASAVLRSCECFGVQDIHFIEEKHKYEVNRNVVKGATKWLTLHRHEGTKAAIRSLKKEGYLLAGTVLSEETIPIQELPLGQKVAILFGTEQFGLTETAGQACDVKVKIPMFGFTESFNLSVSAALIVSELVQRMRSENRNWPLSEAEKNRIRLEWYMKSIRNSEHIAKRFIEEQENGLG